MVWNKRKYLSGLEDAAVLQLYKQKQWPRCIDELFLRYGHLIYGVFLKYTKDKYTAEDLLMELFAKLPQLLIHHDIQQLKPWLHTVARNEALQFIRKSKKQTGISLDENSMDHVIGSKSDETQEEILWKEQQLNLLEKVMEQLKPVQKECIRLFFIEQLSYEEIMNKTQLSFKEVKSHLQNGKRN
ncbi:MAG: sigma-70 family RNA polymerase sigma factor, partial [Chitinophagaceae bacterium]|nr:sigma-70 family RNA polymerase sigma factor [Chitinophagaceae bacterium]